MDPFINHCNNNCANMARSLRRGKKKDLCYIRPMMKKIIKLLLLVATLFIQGACESEHELGQLVVNSLHEGSYEIFNLSTSTDQGISSQGVSHFNIGTKLAPGSYLLLGDCSHQLVKIYPNETTELSSHTVNFITAVEQEENHHFNIKCRRHSSIRALQSFRGTYRLQLFSGKTNLLVSMKPLALDTTGDKFDKSPQSIDISLASIRVDGLKNLPANGSYFISNDSELTAMTEKGIVGVYNHVLPGKYLLELNGSTRMVDVNAGNAIDIKPGAVQISTPKGVDTSLTEKVNSTPLYISYAGNHRINLNEPYLSFPGKWSFSFNGSEHKYPIEIEPEKLKEVHPRSLKVSLDCGPWEWSCLGSKKVYVYQPGAEFPFTTGRTDVPIFFMEKKAEVSMEGSRGIRYKLTKHKSVTSLSTGQVIIQPIPHYVPGNETDLLRIETVYSPFRGHSLDLRLSEPTELTMITGQYRLGQYVSLKSSNSDRWKTSKAIYIKKNTKTDVSIKIYSSNKRYAKISPSSSPRTHQRGRGTNLIRRYRSRSSSIELK